MSPPIIVEQSFSADPRSLWDAITCHKRMVQWFFQEIPGFEARVGFATEFAVETDGVRYTHQWTVNEVVPHTRIAYRWAYREVPGSSEVAFEITSRDSAGSTVRLTHRGCESFPGDTPVFSRHAIVSGWNYFVNQRLKRFIEGGPNETDAHRHHAIDYVELASDTLEATTRFYETAFGWAFNRYGADYLGIQKGRGEAGGLCRSDPGEMRPPLVILYSENLEASQHAVERAGGRITQPIFSFPGGRRFHFTDPGGNVLAVWQHN